MKQKIKLFLNFNILQLKAVLVCNQDQETEIFDSYSLDFGIRSITWSGTENTEQAWQINKKPFYCMGINRHEDFPVNIL